MRRRIYATIAAVLFIALTAELVLLAYNLGRFKIELDETLKNVGAKIDATRERANRIEHHLQSLGHPPGKPPEQAP